jgi:hypothetical protein
VTPAAEVGKPAPDFSLVDTEGKPVKLADYKGKIVVLEWFNPGCPFVRASHTKGALVDAAKRVVAAAEKAKGAAKPALDVVWLAINSSAPGKEGHGAAKNIEAKKTYGMAHPVLLDEAGTVGRAYGAERTPHMFVIDSKGNLVYKGAPDNSPDGEGESPEGGQLVRYVDQAVKDLLAGKPVQVASSKPYGCSVKYAK